ncbi:MAG TPA: dihydroorotate dehydrogenase-like protein [Streptosporangiaceae bacterium]|nr:dihydroorotate dehydrogenase-like protein [Streptosporangiaceae bacterium]
MDLSTTYLGLRLRNPVVASAGPVTSTADGIRALADAGVGAVVLPSLFEEQLRRESDRDSELAAAGTESFPEALSYLPEVAFDMWPHQYLHLIEKAAEAAGVPVIASLNGASPGGWTGYAAAMQDAGAAAIELNVYYLTADPLIPARDAERRYTEILGAVRAAVRIPVAVKIGPYFSSPGEMAARLDAAGADGLVLFNRFMQTDIDPETVTASQGFRLSSRAEAALPRAWISRLRGTVRCSLAASTGVETWADVAAYLLAGADVVMTTSALLRRGPQYAGDLVDGLAAWMGRKGFAAVTELRGMLSAAAGHPVPGRTGYLSAIEQATRAFG